jgi:hypothetical protein
MNYKFDNIFFHGTLKKNLDEILNKGLKTRYARATFTQSPKYALYFSGKDPKKEGLLLVFKNKNIKKAKDSHLISKKKQKIITGWPNRWRTEQFGFYPKVYKKEPVLDKKYLLGIFAYNSQFLKALDSIFNNIVQAKLNKKIITGYMREIENVLSNKKIQIIKPKIYLKKLSDIAVYGMIRNAILREIRANYISSLVLNGWKIYNPGQEPCDRWLKERKDIVKQMKAISKIINEDFIPADVRKEFNLRMPHCIHNI